jgi:hypothetical protein
MTPEQDAALQQIESIHWYVRTTGTITTEWFFFACAVNAAVAGWLIETGRAHIATIMPKLFILCNAAIVPMYWVFVPGYYLWAFRNSRALMDSLTTLRETPNTFPVILWIPASLALGFIALAMALVWWYFFFTKRGAERLKKLVNRTAA